MEWGARYRCCWPPSSPAPVVVGLGLAPVIGTVDDGVHHVGCSDCHWLPLWFTNCPGQCCAIAYGWGTAVIFIPIVVLTLYEPRSSQIGHALGAAIGAVAVVLYSPLWMRNKLSTYSWGAFVLPLGVLGWLIQEPLSLQQQQDLLEEVTIDMPHLKWIHRAWMGKVGSEIEIFHSELWLASAEELTAELLQQRWLSEHQLESFSWWSKR